MGATAVWAHGGDPYVGGPTQIVGRCASSAEKLLLRLLAETLRSQPAFAVRTVMTAVESVTLLAGNSFGISWMMLVLAFPGEEFDWPVEQVAERAGCDVAAVCRVG